MKTIEATIKDVRNYVGWQDSLEVSDDTLVLVHEDGSVNDAINGELICEDGFGGNESAEVEWKGYWEF